MKWFFLVVSNLAAFQDAAFVYPHGRFLATQEVAWRVENKLAGGVASRKEQ